MYINEQEKSLNAPVTRRTIQSKFAVKQHEKCKDCAECTNTNLEVKTSLRRPTEFLEAITPLVKAFKNPYNEQKLLQYENIKCSKAKTFTLQTSLGKP